MDTACIPLQKGSKGHRRPGEVSGEANAPSAPASAEGSGELRTKQAQDTGIPQWGASAQSPDWQAAGDSSSPGSLSPTSEVQSSRLPAST